MGYTARSIDALVLHIVHLFETGSCDSTSLPNPIDDLRLGNYERCSCLKAKLNLTYLTLHYTPFHISLIPMALIVGNTRSCNNPVKGHKNWFEVTNVLVFVVTYITICTCHALSVSIQPVTLPTQCFPVLAI